MAKPAPAPPASGERRISISYEGFRSWPEDVHAEWVDGEMIVFMPPKTIHQQIVNWLVQLLGLYVKLLNLGEVIAAPFEMRVHAEASGREPDIVFVATEHLGRLTAKRLDGPADLVVEVISDESATRDRQEKFAEYAAGGVREYWLIDPRAGKQRVDCYGLTAEGQYRAVPPDAAGRYHAQVLPGFWFAEAWLWQEPLPNPLLLLAEIAPQALRAALADKLGLS
jgi:Uma2 family endonuclease